ncbi:Anthranilate phosphoribosyltransferase [Labeo rohita]|uniref:Anthranilate phosphoribosyltransferase n=1 Tax=Labeo rohita TaxID=84645 RepID=A0ABQ8L3F7_LABRO|nr:Anthranilate phosphoribosyltransferase [Labeo rohita]
MILNLNNWPTNEDTQPVQNCLRTLVPLKQFHMASAAAVTLLGLFHMRSLQHWLHRSLDGQDTLHTLHDHHVWSCLELQTTLWLFHTSTIREVYDHSAYLNLPAIFFSGDSNSPDGPADLKLIQRSPVSLLSQAGLVGCALLAHPKLTFLVTAPPGRIPRRNNLLSQGQSITWHPHPYLQNLHVWLLDGMRQT